MRIALISDVYRPVVNGVVNHVALLKRYLEQWGEQVWLFVPGAPGGHGQDEPNVIRFPGIPILGTGYHIGAAVDARSRELLRQVDVIHVHHPFISGSIGLFFARRYNIPLVFTNHTRYDLYVQQYLPLVPETISEAALQAYFQMFSQGCSAVIAPSESVAQVIREEWKVKAPVVVIPNGIELDAFRAPPGRVRREDLGIPLDAVVAVYVGRITGEKSSLRLARIGAILAEEHPHFRLLMVGGGPELEACRRVVQEMEAGERVHLTGPVPYEDVPDYLHLSDLFVSTSITEVHPLSFIEAAAAGLPAVGIDSPGVRDVICHGETGLLARDNDLSFGLRALRLVGDREMRERLGQTACRWSTRFAAHTTARAVLRLYQEVVEGGSGIGSGGTLSRGMGA